MRRLVYGDCGFGASWTPKRTGRAGLQPAGLRESSTLDEELGKISGMRTSSGFLNFFFTGLHSNSTSLNLSQEAESVAPTMLIHTTLHLSAF